MALCYSPHEPKPRQNGHVAIHAIGPTLEIPRLRPVLRSINEKDVEDLYARMMCSRHRSLAGKYE